jgi:hypothetical protein
LNSLQREYEELQFSSLVASQGTRLGGKTSSHLSKRQKLLEAAERRALTQMPPRKLGGESKEYFSSFSPVEMALQAAEWRRRDSIWCGSERPPDDEPEEKEKVVTQPQGQPNSLQKTLIDLTSDLDQESSSEEWGCALCTFLNPSTRKTCEMCEQLTGILQMIYSNVSIEVF